ncbi:hypothetical protein CDL15_Pgr000036 [Punica granatum]|uniref:Uncharacterized protein n=1 Tax=Punica granatum TaxID=22663 RepID=A0A218VR66_PUNGR|nr:hypothetical protein CDL15_Pgr000036 [Punica granatum]PKI62403.1 hypothetical protein CRG98_017209 [Punica granatum]
MNKLLQDSIRRADLLSKSFESFGTEHVVVAGEGEFQGGINREIEELIRRDWCGVSGSRRISHGQGRGSPRMAEVPRAPGSDVPQL